MKTSARTALVSCAVVMLLSSCDSISDWRLQRSNKTAERIRDQSLACDQCLIHHQPLVLVEICSDFDGRMDFTRATYLLHNRYPNKLPLGSHITKSDGYFRYRKVAHCEACDREFKQALKR